MANIELIKKRISDAIKTSGLTQTKLAEMLAVSPSCVAHYVKGDIMPSIPTFVDLCLLLDVDPADLLGLKD
ncbi:MAG: helix-turn-helix domain-containing protein [Clostridia bacterium]|nr:helix-turn-helix domain-containing protein [Clostridia bacterium]